MEDVRSRRGGRFKLAAPRIPQSKKYGRVKTLWIPEDLYRETLTPERSERADLYRTELWADIRRRNLKAVCWCGCGEPAKELDHLLGHNNKQALDVALALGIPCAATWQERFWKGPFCSLSRSCHSRKTHAEKNGNLLGWIQDVSKRKAAE